MTAGSSIVAISSMRPGQRGQRRTSRSKARRIRAAHVQERGVAAPARYFVLEQAESYLTRRLFRQMVARVGRLVWHPT